MGSRISDHVIGGKKQPAGHLVAVKPVSARRRSGAEPVLLGVDDAPPYRIYWNNAALETGTTVELIAAVGDGSGVLRSDSVTVTLGER